MCPSVFAECHANSCGKFEVGCGLVAALILTAVGGLIGAMEHIHPSTGKNACQFGRRMKLLLRPANSPDAGVLLRQNNRWIDAKWSPDSRLLAVIDHLDGHMSDVYVFGVTAADTAPVLLYHTPDLHSYDVKWEVTGWDTARRELMLDKAVKHEMPGEITHEKVVAHIGGTPLKIEPTE